MTAGAAVPKSSTSGAAHGGLTATGQQQQQQQAAAYEFKMPLHYPRYSKSDYEKMPEWQLDRLLSEYGLPVFGDLDHKRNFTMGAFLWPTHHN